MKTCTDCGTTTKEGEFVSLLAGSIIICDNCNRDDGSIAEPTDMEGMEYSAELIALVRR